VTTVRFSVREWTVGERDVVGEVADDATPDDLRHALAQIGIHVGSAWLNGQPASANRTLTEQHFTHGAVISSGETGADPQPEHGPHIVVISGPEAGAWFPIRPGQSLTIGRSEGDIRLARDRLLSKVHARFDFNGQEVVVSDLGSSNGTIVEGAIIAVPTAVGPNTYVHIGSSVLAVVNVDSRDIARLGTPDGAAYPFPRTFREALEPLRREVRLPRPLAEESSGAGSTWWRSLLPLVSGVGFALVTGNYLFLLISALAPLVYFGDAIRQKNKRRRTDAVERGRWEKDTADARHSFAEAWTEERRRLRAASPFGGSANVYAMVRHRRLWERRPSDEDFTSVTVGLATRPSAVALVQQGGDDSRREQQPMWGTPVDVNLAATGSLAVIGERDRARAVVRGMLLGLAVTHSPGDLRMWLFSAPDGAHEWSPVRWLPHSMQDDATCQIATTAEARSTMLSRLRQILDQRREIRRGSNDPIPVPVHIVVFDGADSVARHDLAELLALGPAVGIVGIVVDPQVAPDGVQGSLMLGDAADQALFESRSQPRIENVLTAEMPVQWAELSSRRLAGLRPSLTGRAELSATSERLARLVGADRTPARALLQNWVGASPKTKVVVGTVADASFSLDVVRDGPHGLIGGTTRSGKTEFLKTLITSLSWHNHPDDLCFVVVDFKGGIDYVSLADLPHMLEVSSNQDLAGFERTIRLLASELRRRQSLFESVNVANLDAYRIARQRQPNLVAIPRLVVLIDEFSEMMSSDVGREQLRQVESMARIGGGLGLHLLLITQNFEGQLPDQVAANAGLRICFRVQDPAHSRIVLGTGLASTISAAAKGRAYARFQGGEPAEFQTARVAGRRPDLQSSGPAASVRLQTFDTLFYAFAQETIIDVPAEETDMHAMLQTIDAAARASGWSRPAVPWPKILPSELGLEHVAGASTPDNFAIGIADLPDQQRQAPFHLRTSDDHVALLGNARADLGTALTTIACSAALSSSPDDLHIYGIDFTGRGLARMARLPHCGAVASRSDAHAMRIARYLVDQLALRRAELAAEGVASLDELRDRTGKSFPHLLLLVAGAEKLSSVGNYDEASPVNAPIATLLAEGSGLGIQVVLAGLPIVAMYRPGSAVDRRIAFAAADVGDYVNLGCPRSLLGEMSGPRRGVDIASRVVVQICSLAGGEANETDVLEALVDRLDAMWPVDRLSRPPHRLHEVTWPTRLSTLLHDAGAPPVRVHMPIPIALDNNSGETFWLSAAEVGRSMFVAGGRRSGRSNALLAIGLSARARGWSVIAVALSDASPFHEPGCPLSPTPFERVDETISRTTGGALVLIDDVHRLAGQTIEGAPTKLDSADLVVMSGTTGYFGGLQREVTNTGASAAKRGIVLMPEGFADLEILNVPSSRLRGDSSSGRRAGQGLMGADGELIDLTIPLVDVR
jgi:DNA segregation ATPase FtsK/SpoIIIE, S-DNA-T family